MSTSNHGRLSHSAAHEAVATPPIAINGRTPTVETSYEKVSPMIDRWRTHARVRLDAIRVPTDVYCQQELRATVTGADRYGALAALEAVLGQLLEAVTHERQLALGKDFSTTCACHSCCTMSCCNPVIEPACIQVAIAL
jgi:hypothetical protein